MKQYLGFGFVFVTLLATAAVCTMIVLLVPGTPTNEEFSAQPCVARQFEYDSIACVCNSSYCDTIPAISSLDDQQIIFYTSTKDGLRFSKRESTFQSTAPDAAINFVVDATRRYQTMKGFGGAFTDAAGINILSLSSSSQQRLLESYYSTQGIEYSMGRIPMASCDFSTRLYTYADQPDDFNMKNFALAQEDIQYKIPLIKRAMEISDRQMSFFGSPWSAPAWMKDNNALIGRGGLIGEAGGKYYQAWALYFSRFLEEYERNGIKLWGITAQNEPSDGNAKNFSFQCMGFTAEQQRDFIKLDLGPMLKSRGHGDIELMIGDDQRFVLPEWAQTVLNDPDAAKYVSGIGVHWYMDWLVRASKLNETHNQFPDNFILATEACTGAMPWSSNHVELGSWVRGQRYSEDILEDVNNWVVGWMDWNLALDMEGGPNWVKNFVDAPIIVNKDKDEFYKQPMFYHLGHFSKFVHEGSVRVGVSGPGQDGDLKYAAFLDGSTVTLVILNKSRVKVKANIEKSSGKVPVEIPPNSIQTFIWSL